MAVSSKKISAKQIVRAIVPDSLKPAVTEAYFKLIGNFYKGGDKYCSCCDNQIKKFLDFDSYGNKRKALRCPVCGSLPRHRMMIKYFDAETDIFDRKCRFIHFAPEPPLMKRFQPSSNIDYTTADLFHPLGEMKWNIEDIPLEDSTVDFVMVSHVLNHVDDDLKAMSELFRILKRGGTCIVLSTVDETIEQSVINNEARTPAERKTAFGRSDIARIYGNDFTDRLGSVGFEVEKRKYAKELPAELAKRMNLKMEAPIFIGKRA